MTRHSIGWWTKSLLAAVRRIAAIGLPMFAGLCLIIGMPVLFAQLMQAKPGSGQAQTVIFRGRQVLVPAGASAKADPPGSTEPVPIPGGDVIPPLIHIFVPGPTSLAFDGVDVEPNGITNFRGFVAQGYPVGTATGSDGKTYNLMTDMRVFQGEYVSADGTHHRGTFVLI